MIDTPESRNLNTIYSRLKEQYPNTTLARNETFHDYEELLNRLYKFFQTEVLYLCECGDPNATARVIMHYLKALPVMREFPFKTREILMKNFGREYVSDYPLLQFLAYTLNHYGLVCHGGNASINHASITDLGMDCLFVLEEWFRIYDDDPEVRDPTIYGSCPKERFPLENRTEEKIDADK